MKGFITILCLLCLVISGCSTSSGSFGEVSKKYPSSKVSFVPNKKFTFFVNKKDGEILYVRCWNLFDDQISLEFVVQPGK